MSIWSSVTGAVVIHKSKKTSMKDLVESVFDEHSLDIMTSDQGESWCHVFNIDFSEDGENAFYTAQSFIRTLNQRKVEWIDLEMNIRWY
jgi:hypothetical protein